MELFYYLTVASASFFLGAAGPLMVQWWKRWRKARWDRRVMKAAKEAPYDP